jgi:hypothetical protein
MKYLDSVEVVRYTIGTRNKTITSLRTEPADLTLDPFWWGFTQDPFSLGGSTLTEDSLLWKEHLHTLPNNGRDRVTV